MIRARFRHLARFALAAMLAATLAPSVAHALQTSALAVAGIGVCATPGGGGAPQGAAGDPDGHCALCTPTASPVLPSTDSTFARAKPGSGHAASACEQTPVQARAWAPASARAPPFASV